MWPHLKWGLCWCSQNEGFEVFRALRIRWMGPEWHSKCNLGGQERWQRHTEEDAVKSETRVKWPEVGMSGQPAQDGSSGSLTADFSGKVALPTPWFQISVSEWWEVLQKLIENAQYEKTVHGSQKKKTFCIKISLSLNPIFHELFEVSWVCYLQAFRL